MGENIIDLCSSIGKKIWAISEVEFAMKQEGAKFLRVKTIECIGFPKLDPTRDIRLDLSIDSISHLSNIGSLSCWNGTRGTWVCRRVLSRLMWGHWCGC